MEYRPCTAGETLFREGDDASAIFLVLTGTLAISTTSQRTVHTLRSGDVVGERAVMAHTTRGSTVAADTASELLCFPAAAYRRICGSRAERARASTRLFLRQRGPWSFGFSEEALESVACNCVPKVYPGDCPLWVEGDDVSIWNFVPIVRHGELALLRAQDARLASLTRQHRLQLVSSALQVTFRKASEHHGDAPPARATAPVETRPPCDAKLVQVCALGPGAIFVDASHVEAMKLEDRIRAATEAEDATADKKDHKEEAARRRASLVTKTSCEILWLSLSVFKRLAQLEPTVADELSFHYPSEEESAQLEHESELWAHYKKKILTDSLLGLPQVRNAGRGLVVATELSRAEVSRFRKDDESDVLGLPLRKPRDSDPSEWTSGEILGSLPDHYYGALHSDAPTERITCPSGHALEQTRTPHDGMFCDRCACSFPADTSMLGCALCDFDLCGRCYFSQCAQGASPTSKPMRGGSPGDASATTLSVAEATHVTLASKSLNSKSSKQRTPRALTALSAHATRLGHTRTGDSSRARVTSR